MSVSDDLRRNFATIKRLRARIKALEARPTYDPERQSIITWHPAEETPRDPAHDVLLRFEGKERPGIGYYHRDPGHEEWRILTSPYGRDEPRGAIIGWAAFPATRQVPA